MSQQNVSVVRALIDAANRGDFSEALADDSELVTALADDYELVTASEMPDAGTYRGEEARVWWEAWVESFDSLTLEPVELLDAGDRVFAEVVQRGTPRGGSTSVELRVWTVYTFTKGALRRAEVFMSRSQALEAAGLSE